MRRLKSTNGIRQIQLRPSDINCYTDCSGGCYAVPFRFGSFVIPNSCQQQRQLFGHQERPYVICDMPLLA